MFGSPPHHSVAEADTTDPSSPPTTPPLPAVGDRGRGKHAVHLLAEENTNLGCVWKGGELGQSQKGAMRN